MLGPLRQLCPTQTHLSPFSDGSLDCGEQMSRERERVKSIVSVWHRASHLSSFPKLAENSLNLKLTMCHLDWKNLRHCVCVCVHCTGNNLPPSPLSSLSVTSAVKSLSVLSRAPEGTVHCSVRYFQSSCITCNQTIFGNIQDFANKVYTVCCLCRCLLWA